MTLLRPVGLAAALALPFSLAAPVGAQEHAPAVTEAPLPAFPGPPGRAAQTQGGQIIRVINLDASGPGSLREGIEADGPRGAGDVECGGRDNIAVDQVGGPLRMFGRYTTSNARIIQTRRPPVWWEGLMPMPVLDVRRAGHSQVEARPWGRDMRDEVLDRPAARRGT